MTAVAPRIPRSLLTVVDLTATFVFAMEGSIAATYYDVDILGVFVLGFSTALAGGIVRDVLIGCTPPAPRPCARRPTRWWRSRDRPSCGSWTAASTTSRWACYR